MDENIFEFEKLLVYQKALDYIDFIYQITEHFPNTEKFGLVDNFRRAAQSIALNIGEGSGGTKAEFKNFLRISRRSIRECIVSTTISKRRGFITDKEAVESMEKCVELSKMISGLLKSLG